MARAARTTARDPRLVVLPVLGLFLGLIVALFVSDAASVAEPAVAAPLRPPAETPVAPSERPRRPPPRPQRVAAPTVIEVPSIEVRARIVPVGLNVDGSMEVPDFGLAGWYELGPRPGQPGPAVVAAHVDSKAGPDVFYRLHELRTGAVIRIRRADGSAQTWTVTSSEQTPKDELPVDRIWNDTRQQVLRLVTCGGTFDYATGSYEDNIIVYADSRG